MRSATRLLAPLLVSGAASYAAFAPCGTCPPPLDARDARAPFRRLLVSLAYAPAAAAPAGGGEARVEAAQCDDNVRFFYRHGLDRETTDVVVSVVGESPMPPLPPRGAGVTVRRHACDEGGDTGELLAHTALLKALGARRALGKYSHVALMGCAARGPYALADASTCPAAYVGWRSKREDGPRWLYPFAARLAGEPNGSTAGGVALVGPTVSLQGRYAHVQTHFALTAVRHVPRLVWALGRRRALGERCDERDARALNWIDARPHTLDEQRLADLSVGRGADVAPHACASGTERAWSGSERVPISCATRGERGGAPPRGGRRLTAPLVVDAAPSRGAAAAATAAAATAEAAPVGAASARARPGGGAAVNVAALLHDGAERLRMETEVFLSQLALHEGDNIASLMRSQQRWDFRRCAFGREPPSAAELVARSLDADPRLSATGACPLELVFAFFGGQPLADGALPKQLCNGTRTAERLDADGLLALSAPAEPHPPPRMPRGQTPHAARAIERADEAPPTRDAAANAAVAAAAAIAERDAGARRALAARMWAAEQRSALQERLEDYVARNRMVPRLDRLPPCNEACPACEPFARAVLPPFASEPAAPPLLTAEIAVSQCSYPLAFLTQLAADVAGAGGLRLVRVSVYSKCGQTPALPPLPSGVDARVVPLPNVGRCDHTWAHHLAARYGALADLVLLVKDSHETYPIERLRRLSVSVPDALEQARVGGFACFRAGELSPSRWHLRRQVFTFRMGRYASAALLAPAGTVPEAAAARALDGAQFKSPYDHFQFLAKALDESELLRLLDAEFVPVCYGGSFAVTRERVHAVSQGTFVRLRALLNRGVDSIEEGHFMERTWAALLAPPLTAAESAAFGECVANDYWARPAPDAVPTKGHGLQGNTYGGLVKRCCCARARGGRGGAGVDPAG
ncbi:hypothetical protein KFE25_011273 [Diacronema lutheri]|uniref:Uncharacterized protein n=1 Tax=Diacronema lutheri TaxID=2081491 RepID=A0A8J6C777_DIALT|nr:hypothetical protein KFE25_011273 [Diacronema lutheri]